MSEFVSSIKKFSSKVEFLTTKVFQDSCKDISINIADGSPVSTGRLLGQWAPSVGSQSTYTFQGGPSAWRRVPGGYQKNKGIAATNKSAAMTNLLPRIGSETAALTKTTPFYFTNDTSYIQNAEHEGWGGTGPYHMIEQGVLGWEQVVNNVVLRNKSG